MLLQVIITLTVFDYNFDILSISFPGYIDIHVIYVSKAANLFEILTRYSSLVPCLAS
jgi:hypothetical protein